jgi:hypothetical protein
MREDRSQSPNPWSERAPPPADLYKKKTTNYVAVLGVILVVVLLLILVALMSALSGGDRTHDQLPGPLDGTWETQGTATFYMMTDWPNGQLVDVGQEARAVVLVITSTSDVSRVDVTMSYVTYDSTIQNDSFYMPDPSPEHYDGQLTGNSLYLTQDGVQKGTFTFDDTTIRGTWYDVESGGLIFQETYTTNDGIVLHRTM